MERQLVINNKQKHMSDPRKAADSDTEKSSSPNAPNETAVGV